MKKKYYIPGIILTVFSCLFYITNAGWSDKPAAPFFKYVGVKSCTAACHKGDSKGNQFEIWQDSKHSKAFLNLQTPEADQIAKDKGFSTSAAETPLCIKCHVLGKDMDTAEVDITFDKTQGVQCETCHGPGSEYKKMAIMKDKQQAVANGLIIHDDGAEFCKSCHNSDSPTFKSFDYETYWAKIKHTNPNITK